MNWKGLQFLLKFCKLDTFGKNCPSLYGNCPRNNKKNVIV